MEDPKYSRVSFEGYTHRFVVVLKTSDDHREDVKVDIYSNSGDKQKFTEFIDQKKSEKVTSFEIVRVATKEQDDLDTEFITQTLKGI